MNKKILIITLGSIIIVVVVGLFIFLNFNSYKCPDSTYKLKNKRCIKEETSKTYQKLICDEGYRVIDNKCAKVTSKEAAYEYVCPSGYTKDNQMCTKKLTSDLVINHYCGKVKTDEDKCEVFKKPLIDYNTGKKYCETGNLIGSNCVSYKNASTKKECPGGYRKEGKICTKIDTVTATIVRTCEEGYILKDKVCEHYEYKEGLYKTSCKEGFVLNGDTCFRRVNIKAIKK